MQSVFNPIGLSVYVDILGTAAVTRKMIIQLLAIDPAPVLCASSLCSGCFILSSFSFVSLIASFRFLTVIVRG